MMMMTDFGVLIVMMTDFADEEPCQTERLPPPPQKDR